MASSWRSPVNRKDDSPKSTRTTTLWLFPLSNPPDDQPGSASTDPQRTRTRGSVPAQFTGSMTWFVNPSPPPMSRVSIPWYSTSAQIPAPRPPEAPPPRVGAGAVHRINDLVRQPVTTANVPGLDSLVFNVRPGRGEILKPPLLRAAGSRAQAVVEG